MAVAFGIPTLIVYPFDYSPWNARSPPHSLATMFYSPQARTLLRFINACQLFSLSSTLTLRTSLLAVPGAAVCSLFTLSVDVSRSVPASARCIPALLLVVLYVTYAVFLSPAQVKYAYRCTPLPPPPYGALLRSTEPLLSPDANVTFRDISQLTCRPPPLISTPSLVYRTCLCSPAPRFFGA
ncbi:hypothetical protein VTO73DRAFT_8414 [Trametes versicolor]